MATINDIMLSKAYISNSSSKKLHSVMRFILGDRMEKDYLSLSTRMCNIQVYMANHYYDTSLRSMGA